MLELKQQTPKSGGGGARSLIEHRPASYFEGTHRYESTSADTNTTLLPGDIPQDTHQNTVTNIRCMAGFTLVELIVVIVILGILAAIAVPALTGYIAKSQDKEYEMRAREIVVAARSVIDDAYAKGEMSSPAAATFIANADTFYKTRLWSLNSISSVSVADQQEFPRRVAALIGEPYHENAGYEVYHLITS